MKTIPIWFIEGEKTGYTSIGQAQAVARMLFRISDDQTPRRIMRGEVKMDDAVHVETVTKRRKRKSAAA